MTYNKIYYAYSDVMTLRTILAHTVNLHVQEPVQDSSGSLASLGKVESAQEWLIKLQLVLVSVA